MRSSTGDYYPGLDHLRALAAFLVFGWHFTHGFYGFPAPFGPGAIPIFAPFNEGHCGVALFMCLSGYLFAKLLDGKQVVWRSFYWNRFLRLAPLLIVVLTFDGMIVVFFHPDLMGTYAIYVVLGAVKPLWNHGGWSIAVEIHFYLLLWIIMPLRRRWAPSVFGFLVLGLAARVLIYAAGGDVEYYAYSTIIGRIDQFVLGIAAFGFRGRLRGRHMWIAVAGAAFIGFYQWFTHIGGFYGTQGNRAVWILIPTIDAAFFSFLVAYYDTSFTFSRRWFWRLLQATGSVSFSIYLLHDYVAFDVARWANDYVPAMAAWEVSELFAIAVFAAFIPVAWLSYRFVEMPFLGFRTNYTRQISPSTKLPASFPKVIRPEASV